MKRAKGLGFRGPHSPVFVTNSSVDSKIKFPTSPLPLKGPYDCDKGLTHHQLYSLKMVLKGSLDLVTRVIIKVTILIITYNLS